MPKRSSKPPKATRALKPDPNQAALDAVAALTGQTREQLEGKNPAAVALGHLGGKKGGPARARKLTAEQRREIARGAANVRWRQKGSP